MPLSDAVLKRKDDVKADVQKMHDWLDAGNATHGYSVRELHSVLHLESDINDVLNYLANQGFVHCLDEKIMHNGEYPPQWSCVWMQDQLKSRLSCCL